MGELVVAIVQEQKENVEQATVTHLTKFLKTTASRIRNRI